MGVDVIAYNAIIIANLLERLTGPTGIFVSVVFTLIIAVDGRADTIDRYNCVTR